MSPYVRQPLPDYPWEHEPDDDPDAWNEDIPVNIYGETEDENEDR